MSAATFGIFIVAVGGAQADVPAISHDLSVGSKGINVQSLQRFLNDNGFKIAASGAGSPGHETTLFGYATRAALLKFQSAHGIVPATGYFGAKTRAYLASLSRTGSVGSSPAAPASDSADKNDLLRSQIAALQQQLSALLSQSNALLSQSNPAETVPPTITAVDFSNGGNSQLIGVGDAITVTFSKPIAAQSVNGALVAGGSVSGVPYSQTGGVTLTSSGQVTVNGIVDFSVGSILNPGSFGVTLALDPTGRILTVNLASGGNILISNKNLSAADQIGGTVKDDSGNIMQSAGGVVALGGNFGSVSSGSSFIDAINVSNGGKNGYIDDSDTIAITFDQPVDPKSINHGLYNGGSVQIVPSSQTGGVTVSSSGQVTINGIADFNMGSVNNSGSFGTRLSLNATGKILTVTLVDGLDVRIASENFGAADQTGGTVRDLNGNSVVSESSIGAPTGSFGGSGINAGSVPYITAINVSNGGKSGYIDDGDAIAVTFNEAIDPKSLNPNLGDGVSVPNIASTQTGGVTVSSSGQVTINGIADFNMGSVNNSGSGNFSSRMSLDQAGRILTILLTSGNDIAINNENFASADQTGGTVKDGNGNIMSSVTGILTPGGTFGGQINSGSGTVPPYIAAINVTNGGDDGYIDDGDAITITFSEPINPKSVNNGLDDGNYVINVLSTQTGGVTVSSGGEVTVNGIADFYMGSVANSTGFTVQLALDATGKVLTVTIADGESAQITNEAFGSVYQIGNTIKDTSGNKMVSQTAVLLPTGTFGGKN